MTNYTLIVEMVKRAKAEMDMHKAKRDETRCWYSGHKAKARRAIVTAKELLSEAAKELEAIE